MSGNKKLMDNIDQLDQALEKGWLDLKRSSVWDELIKEFPRWQRDYESATAFAREFGNPIYDAAARRIGRPFRLVAAQLGLSFVEDFPGLFIDSVEEEIHPRYEVRSFFLEAWYGGRPVGILKISFPHRHDVFDLPDAPSVTLLP